MKLTTTSFENSEVNKAKSENFWLGVILVQVLNAVLLLGLFVLSPSKDGSVALIFPPGMSASEAVDRATSSGFSFLRSGAKDWIVVIMPPDNKQSVWSHALATGALAVVNPALAGNCNTAI